MRSDADVIIVGAGLAGLVAAAELLDAGRKIIILDQEPEASLGGQAVLVTASLLYGRYRSRFGSSAAKGSRR